ncbi:MAG: glycoside hydrolase family 1 protein, partial [bacterium]
KAGLPRVKAGQPADKSRRSRLRYYQTLKFPRGFLWGAATSAHQVEGDNKYNDWWAWEQASKHHLKSGQACQSYKLYNQDIALVKKLRQNAHRFSIEWSRIEPKEGQWDYNAIRHYRQVLAELKRQGLESMVTLHHYTNPRWFAEKGGWTKKKNIFYFERYVKFIVAELGGLVDFWVTINEPLVYASQSYLVGVWPPCQRRRWQAYRVYRHLATAHIKAYQAIHRLAKAKGWRRPKVGVAHNAVSIYSYRKNSLGDYLFMRLANFIWNHSFYFLTKGRHDFLGINYYFHFRISRFNFNPVKFFVNIRNEHREMSSVGWEVYPQGIFDILLNMKRYNLPIYITENGVATDNESKRERYLVSYLKEVYHAILAGAPVKGYFYWSLLDNFEWEKGFRPRFGLIDVNYNNFKRTVKNTAKIYAEICKGNSITKRLLKLIGYAIEVKPKKDI